MQERRTGSVAQIPADEEIKYVGGLEPCESSITFKSWSTCIQRFPQTKNANAKRVLKKQLRKEGDMCLLGLRFLRQWPQKTEYKIVFMLTSLQ